MTKHRPVHTTGIKMWNVTPATYCGCLKKGGGKSYGVLCLTLYCTPILWPIDSSQNRVSIENKHETILCAQAYNATRIFRSTPLKQLVATTESYYNELHNSMSNHHLAICTPRNKVFTIWRILHTVNKVGMTLFRTKNKKWIHSISITGQDKNTLKQFKTVQHSSVQFKTQFQRARMGKNDDPKNEQWLLINYVQGRI